jgi:D-3-phosphoglycerate dehydrogenase
LYKIQLFNNISEKGLNNFDAKFFQLSKDSEITNPDCVLLRSHQLLLENISSSVKAIARAGSGVNNIPVAQLTERGVPVFNTPGANSNAVKELVLAGLFLSARNICNAWQYVNNLSSNEYVNKNQDEISQYIEQGKKQFKGVELPGKTLAVIGLGAIGVKVANAARSLGMNVIGYDPGITVERAWQLSSDVVKAKTLIGSIKKADFITVHVPLLKDTAELINKDLLSLIKPTSVILNFARNEIANEQDIKNHLNENKLACYVTDFPSKVLQDNPKVIALPHIGASTQEAEENCAVQAVDTLSTYMLKGFIQNSVNFPDVVFSDEFEHRLAIINKNVPNMVAQFTSILAEEDLNIIDLINKSRDNIAYSLIDLNKEPTENLLKKIQAIEGVLAVRKITN